MRDIINNLRVPAIISSLLLLPLLILELINQPGFQEAFPIYLFVILWLLPVIFTFTLISLMYNLRGGQSIKDNLTGFLLKVAIIILAAGLWVAIILDQMPCFLGIPNCD